MISWNESLQWTTGLGPHIELFNEVRQRLALSESAKELEDRYHEELPICFSPEEEVQDSLRVAKSAGWIIAVITNSADAQLQCAKINAAEITELVDAVCISAIDGLPKPDPFISSGCRTMWVLARSGMDDWRRSDCRYRRRRRH